MSSLFPSTTWLDGKAYFGHDVGHHGATLRMVEPAAKVVIGTAILFAGAVPQTASRPATPVADLQAEGSSRRTATWRPSRSAVSKAPRPSRHLVDDPAYGTIWVPSPERLS